jgi:hypothetical protein
MPIIIANPLLSVAAASSSGPGTPVVVWSLVLSSAQALGNYDIRNVHSSLSGGGSFVRVRFEAPSSGTYALDKASIGIQSSGGDMTATPVELLFSGVSGFSISNGAQITSDWATLTFTSSSVLLVHTANSASSSIPSGTGNGQYYNAAPGASDYATAALSGYAFQAAVTYGVNQIEAG